MSAPLTAKTFVYSVDRADNRALRRYEYELPPSMQTKFHRAQSNDEGLAVCSSRIVLNIEDRCPADSLDVGELCKRCFKDS